MFSPTETHEEKSSKVSGADFYNRTTTYTWAKNNKTVSLVFSKVIYLDEYLSYVSLDSKDENLIK